MISIVFALALAASAQPPDATIPAKIQSESIYATTRVTNDSKVGSGVTIAVQDGYAYVLTACHILDSPGDVKVDFYSKSSGKTPEPLLATRPSDVQIAVKLPTPDFALLKILLPKKSKSNDTSGVRDVVVTPIVARLAPALDRPKHFPTTVYSIGCSEGASPTITLAKLIGTRIKKISQTDLARFWETEDPHKAGRSGGPLLDKEGRVIGICSANTTLPNSRHGYFTHLDEIEVWMQKNGYDWLFDRPAGK